MSNHLAVATVTAALKARIQEALDADVPGAKVRIGRPDGELGQNGAARVNLYLYQVTTNPAMRNAHQPARGASGRGVATPRVALDLHYLLSFYGDSTAFEPERMLGSVARVLEEVPLLTRARIEKVIADDPQNLSGSDLHRAPELVKAHPAALTLEELSKLWSVFFQVPYALSLAYQCTTVIVEASTPTGPALPVTRPAIVPFPTGGPTISAVRAQAGSAFPIEWGGTAVLEGSGLGAHGLGLRVGPHDVAMAEVTVRPGRIELPLTQAALGGAVLAAGMHPVRTVLPAPGGAPAHLVRTSDSVPLVLRPSVAVPGGAVALDPGPPDQPASGTVKITFSPPVVKGQEVRLMLDERAAGSPAGALLVPHPVADPDFPAATLTFAFTALKRAAYLVRAQVDGIASAPAIDADPSSPTYRQIVGPEVVIP